jgi:uncharacterized protein (DUF4415 family)
MTSRTKKHDQELAALVRLRDEDIDTSEIPEVRDWSKAVVGKFYRPIKEPVTLRLDADVVAWVKSEGPGYQTRINSMLRTAMTGAPIVADTSDFVCRDFRFPSLERHGELGKYNQIAERIEKQGSFFAVA